MPELAFVWKVWLRYAGTVALADFWKDRPRYAGTVELADCLGRLCLDMLVLLS